MLKKRVISGVIVGPAFLAAALFLPTWAILLVLLLVSTLCQLEFYAMMNNAKFPVFRYVGVLFGAAWICATFFNVGPTHSHMAHAYGWENVVLIVGLITVFARQFPQKNNPNPLATVACTLLGIWYVPCLLNYFTRLALCWETTTLAQPLGRTGAYVCVYLITVVKVTDIAAFFTGSRIGRHKCFPRLSPAKTWEGLAGGILGAILTSYFLVSLLAPQLQPLNITPANSLLLGAILAVAAIGGDLFESLLKRAAAMKDSGKVVPGMGGYLDVADSLLFGAPVLYAWIRLTS